MHANNWISIYRKNLIFTPILAYKFMHVNCFIHVMKFYFQLLSIRHIASPYYCR